MRLFDFMAHHGLRLSTTTEYRVEQVLPELASARPTAHSFGKTCKRFFFNRTPRTRCAPCTRCICSLFCCPS